MVVVLFFVVEKVSGKFEVLNIVIGLMGCFSRCRLGCGVGWWLGWVGLWWWFR